MVNYVVGISDNEANRALLDRLTSDDQLTLRTRSGAVYSFIFRSREVVPQTTATVFSQTTPGLTVALMGTDSDQRMIVRGRYVAATAPEIVAPAGPAELGQPVQLDDLQLSVTGATFQFDQTAAPPGFDFFLVDFELQNRGAASFDAGQLRLVLRDAFGNQYALNNLASQVGNNPPLFGLVAPGQLVLATAGFQIPSGLRSAQLTWMASRSDTGDQVEVAIPFSESAGPDEVTVDLVTAEISLDGTGLVLRGQLANTGTERLIINETELSLDSGGTFYLMLSTSPGFPWIVEPGQTLGYAVTFQRPAALDAIFTVLGRQFQLTNLQ